MRLDVQPEGYSSAAEPLAGAHDAVDHALGDLVAALTQSGAMAGQDTGGKSFAAQYDPAASQTAATVGHLGAGCAALGNLVRQAAHNHASADARSNRRGGAAPGPLRMMPVEPRSPYLPSAAGGTGDEPSWWHYVLDHAGGAVWPDANTGALRDASHAWYLLAEALDPLGGQLDTAITMLEIQDSPEVGPAISAVKRLEKIAVDLAESCRSLGKSSNAYAQKVDDTRTHTTHVMEACLAGLAVTAVVGIGLTIVTLGGSDAAAAASADAEILAAVEEVITALDGVIEAADELMVTLEEIATTAADAEAELAPFGPPSQSWPSSARQRRREVPNPRRCRTSRTGGISALLTAGGGRSGRGRAQRETRIRCESWSPQRNIRMAM